MRLPKRPFVPAAAARAIAIAAVLLLLGGAGRGQATPTHASLPAVGDALGGRDHTTIMYGYKKIADMIERDDSLRRQAISIRERMYNQAGMPA